jgi:hypothetical protein
MEDRKKALTDMMSDDEKSGLYIDKFKKESKEIFDNEVKPQIDRAMKIEKAAKNNIIEDWLEEHGDPEIDKKVQKYLELKQENTETLNQNRMTPKEKAEELVNKFIPLCGMEMTEIQCALIAVDEMINMCKLYHIHNIVIDTKIYTELSISYWEEVKQEIINL